MCGFAMSWYVRLTGKTRYRDSQDFGDVVAAADVYALEGSHKQKCKNSPEFVDASHTSLVIFENKFSRQIKHKSSHDHCILIC